MCASLRPERPSFAFVSSGHSALPSVSKALKISARMVLHVGTHVERLQRKGFLEVSCACSAKRGLEDPRRAEAARSSAESSSSMAPSDSASRSRVRAPTSGTTSSPRESIQAIATALRHARVLGLRHAAKRLDEFEVAIEVLRAEPGRVAAEVCRSFDQCPLSSPLDRTAWAVIPIPSSRQAGRISSSIPREINEYSIWRSQIGSWPPGCCG